MKKKCIFLIMISVSFSLGELFENYSRPIIAELNFTNIGDHLITTSSSNKSPYQGEIELTPSFAAKLNFPIYFGQSWSFAGGARYNIQTYILDDDFVAAEKINGAFDEGPLERFGLRGYIVHEKDGEKDFFSRFNMDINSDKLKNDNLFSNYIKFGFLGVHTKKITKSLILGLGLGFGYEWGKPLLLPILYLNWRFSSSHNLDILLPQRIQYTWAYNKKTFFSTHLKLFGASYTLNGDDAGIYERLETRQSQARAFAQVDYEIYDFSWLRFYFGGLYSFKFNVIDPENNTTVLKSQNFFTSLIGIDFIFKVPRKFFKK